MLEPLLTRTAVVWFTGISGAGKTTIANAVAEQLRIQGRWVEVLDGDALRARRPIALGFDRAARAQQASEATDMAADALILGATVLVALISPFRDDRAKARSRFVGHFVEVFVDAPLSVAEQRDPKGLYARARSGEIRDFTGLDSPYEPPIAPELHLDTVNLTPDECASAVLCHLLNRHSETPD